ncbi:(+)-delta-cadinene synthase isozyme A-like [Herrania umbratica]|uniref:(+)-delta-cadinene synthase n=1 Tax=Herrania umbratica TaxID=108875 RepID=A0A6J1BD34_9ROSI|nr:(+)-delta-cadinene synthase isozyme A-like [Herrania umbratica]
MSSQVCSIPASSHDTMSNNENRHLAYFRPNIWGELFLSCPSQVNMDATTQLRFEELKQEVRRTLATPTDKPSQKLHLIDVVQRLGVAYHFEKEIEDSLETIYQDCNVERDDDLHSTAVRFRLLREHGFNVHCESFNKFKDEKGHFKASLISDVRGLLELYEAAHLRVHGESILEEALAFTSYHLKSAETMVEHPLSTQINNALKRPLRKSLPRLVARSYISIYERYVTQEDTLLEFAKLDFKLLQHLHKNEIKEVYRWWKGLDVAKNFPFIRDRLVECYLWMLGVYFEPHYSLARTFLTKVSALTSILDDIYDAYGTREELKIFTNAIQRWDISCINQLPHYMKVCYSELLSVYKEMEELMTKQGKSYRVQLAKEAMKQQVQAYYAEAKWLDENYTPKMEEYMAVASVTCGCHMLTITSFVGMEDAITKETFIWAYNYPKILRASTIISRLMNDIVSHKFEQERGHVVSAVECYMKQYGVSEQGAYNEFDKQIKNAWKDINQEFLKPTVVPKPALNRILNLTRVIDLLYKDEDAYTNAGEAAKASITSLLIDQIPI